MVRPSLTRSPFLCHGLHQQCRRSSFLGPRHPARATVEWEGLGKNGKARDATGSKPAQGTIPETCWNDKAYDWARPQCKGQTELQNLHTAVRLRPAPLEPQPPHPASVRLRQKRQNQFAHGLVCCAVATPASDGERVALPGTLLAGGRRSPGPPRGMGESGTHSDECPLARMRLDRRL